MVLNSLIYIGFCAVVFAIRPEIVQYLNNHDTPRTILVFGLALIVMLDINNLIIFYKREVKNVNQD